MVVQHNMQAINANRMLNVTTGQQAKSTEKLSSGYKINRAADDAAGLSISEKMRRQIRGLDRASTNASDGVSAVQTAEGALNEVHDMLQRMNELATQAANGTNSQTDRESIQNEIDQLTTEIDRVSETTKFNETMLLKGGDGKKDVILTAHDAGLKGTLVDNKDKTAEFSTEMKAGDSVSIGGTTYKLKEDDGKLSTNAKDIANGVKDLKVGDKAIVKNGSSVKGYQVADNLAAITLNTTVNVSGSNKVESAIPDSFSNGKAVNEAGNRVAITYTDSDGVEQTYEMEFSESNQQWEKITGYNSKTGDSNLSGTALYDDSDNNTKGAVTDSELKDVFRTATKMVITQKGTGETMTFGSQDVIAKDLEEAQVGSEIYMTDVSGSGYGFTQDVTATFKDIYQGGDNDVANNLQDENGFVPATFGLGERQVVKETNEVTVGDDNSITIHDAKKLMAQELKASNEIGVDNKDDVSAAFRKSGSDVANELSLSDGDTVTVKKADKNGEDQETTYTIKNDLKDAVGQSFGSIISAGGTSDGFKGLKAEDAGKARITITSADGTVTELKFAWDPKANDDAGKGSWQRVDDDSTLTSTDIKELTKNATKIDYTKDSTMPELTEKQADSVNALTNQSPGATANPTVRWRTDAGMRSDVSQLSSGNKVKVTGSGDAGSAMYYDTGDIEIKNDAGATQNFDMKIGTVEVDKALSFNLHVGADADLNNKIGVNIETMNSKYLGIQGLDVVGKDVNGVNTNDGGKAATYAIDAIENAIQKVNEQRSALGAVQNRLEHTINNLDNVVENTTAAESRIRDTDIADEMVKYSKNNILAQAGQSMLAQANQSTQGALSLLG